MAALKLSPLTVFIVGLSASAIVLSLGYFRYYKPNTEEAANFNAYADQLQIEADKMPAARQRVENAVNLVNRANAGWQEVVLRKTPPRTVREGGIDLAVNRWQLVVDAPQFRNSIQRAVNAQMRAGGVRVIQAPFVPAFPTDTASLVSEGFNYPALGFPAVFLDFGTVTVEGTFEQISRHVEAWSNMPNYLAVTTGLRFDGTSPTLRGTYQLSLVAFLKGNRVAPPVPESAGGTGGFGGGGFGGPPPGMGGPPPNMPGGGRPSGVPGPPAGGAPPGPSAAGTARVE